MNKFISGLIFIGLIACSPYDPTHKPNQSDGGVDNIPPPFPDMVSPINHPTMPVAPPAPATHSDGIKNLDETGIDCGGSSLTRCNLGEGCLKHSDCATDVCSYKKVCIIESEKSCSSHFGGDTCGVGETGTPNAKHVSCCENAPLFGELSNVKLDKFLITAGRMRTFIGRVNGNVRQFVQTLPGDVWRPEYDQYVPSTMAEADEQLGSFFQKKSCHPGDYTGRTYWTTPTPDDFSSFTKDQLDEKALNCVTWHLVTAFCAWDGGRMATGAEIRNAFTNGGQYIQPWLWQPGSVQYSQPEVYQNVTPATTTFNHSFGYNYPETNLRSNPNMDIAYHISPPGRYPQSWNEHGHEVAGNLLNWNASGPFIFSANYSWENHGGDSVGDSDWRAFELTDQQSPNGYYAIGGRCAR